MGLGTGILWAAGGVGTAVLAPLMGYLLESIGWQGTFWDIGLVGGGIVILLTAIFRNRPADLGLKPYGARTAVPTPPAAHRIPVPRPNPSPWYR